MTLIRTLLLLLLLVFVVDVIAINCFFCCNIFHVTVVCSLPVPHSMNQMRNSTGGIGYHPGVETVDNTVSVPGSWAKFSQQNVMRSNGERASSERLRSK